MLYALNIYIVDMISIFIVVRKRRDLYNMKLSAVCVYKQTEAKEC